jgi:AcrR family transcriptional regulator
VNAAVGLIEQDGFGALTLTRVAELLGVTTMALYHHVASRDELVVDRVITRTLVAPALDPDAGWEEQVRASLRALRAALDDDPLILESFLRQPTHPNNVQVAVQLLGAFRDAGLDGNEAVDAFVVTTSFVLGFVAVDHAVAAPGARSLDLETFAPVPALQDMIADLELDDDRDRGFESAVQFVLTLVARATGATGDAPTS